MGCPLVRIMKAEFRSFLKKERATKEEAKRGFASLT